MRKSKRKINSQNTKRSIKKVVPIVLAIVILGIVIVRNALSTGEGLVKEALAETMKVERGNVTEVVESSGTVVSAQQKVFFHL